MRVLDDRGIPLQLVGPLRRLVKALKSLDPEVEAYLCGSHARGDWLKDSDVDLTVISKIFTGLDIGARFSLVKRLMDPGLSLDILAYTPIEFEEARSRSTILEDMLNYALKITSK
ncbi:MAG: nucleotidyltransferase domain-containing protein [Candidatus Bathyarchaeia archaeon]